MVETIKALQRPALAVLFGGGYVLGSFIDAEAVDNLKEPTMLILGILFVERAITHARNGS